MRKDTLITRQFFLKFLAFGFLLSAITGCKKAEHFYDTLNDLPQIDYSTTYAYQSAYIIGDTMVITGKLQPKNNLKITIGGQSAQIVKTDSISFNRGDNTFITLDQVSLLITQPMEGQGREVKVTSGGYSTLGSPVDVYSAGGPGSFKDSLKAVSLKSLNSNQNVFFYCLNGKGDVYYYAANTKDLRHVKKDGAEEILYDLSKSIDTNSDVQVNSFLAGGADPQGQNLYFSVRTNTGYRFLQLDLSTKQLITLNQSSAIGAPYEGEINGVKIIVTGIYPNAKGNIYLAIGTGVSSFINADAIASYNKATGNIVYIYKGFQGASSNNFPGMPGARLSNQSIKSFNFSGDEDLLYAYEYDGLTSTIEIYDLISHVLLQSFSTSPAGATSLYTVIAPFSALKISLGDGSTGLCFGFLPIPGRRLQALLYQSTATLPDQPAKYNFPKWTVFDFINQRTYTYAPGRFMLGGYSFQPTTLGGQAVKDQLLNYDEDGNLYMTASGKNSLIKTQPAQ